jgi:hypothetical protein
MPVAKGTRIGGRAKGTPNKVNLATRDRIMREADPLAFLISVSNGQAIKVGPPESDGEEYPSLDQRIHVAVTLARKVIPDLKPADGGAALPGNLPAITTAAGCGAAMAELLEWVAAGSVPMEQATALAGLIETRRKMLESSEFEAAMRAELETIKAQLQGLADVPVGCSSAP